jgi:hypothetical protein
MRFWTAVFWAGLGICAAACDKKDRPDAAGTALSAPAHERFGSSSEGAPLKTLSPTAGKLASAASGPAASGNPWDKVFDGTAGAAPVAAAPSGKRVVRAGMAIDTDGSHFAPEDPDWRGGTALNYAHHGGPLDASKIPYVVIPLDEKGIKLGDYVVVRYRGRSVLAIVGDRGPRFGEASAATARALGIAPSGLNGGVESGVTYTFFPGSGRRPADEAELSASLQANAPALIARASP